jgi:hypothetical protein
MHLRIVVSFNHYELWNGACDHGEHVSNQVGVFGSCHDGRRRAHDGR